jgi:hypothetical protein
MRPILTQLEGRMLLSTFTVTSTGDDGSAGTLRYEIGVANAAGGNNTIVFSPTVFATHQTITLNGSDLDLSNTTGATTITGPAAGVTINGNSASRIFQIDPNVTASISGVTITGGLGTVRPNTGGYGGTLSYNATYGGGVFNNGNLTLTNVTISDNSAMYGGGLESIGTATLTNVAISGNTATYSGGGLENEGPLSLTNCTISGNSVTNSAGLGGGFCDIYRATLTDCTLSGNSGSRGGGVVDVALSLTLIDCTISGNSGTSGGGLLNYAQAAVTNCTISGNSASSGGGVLNVDERVTLNNTIVAGNYSGATPSDIIDIHTSGATVVGSYNLIGTGGSAGLTNGSGGNIVGVANPGLAPLGNYGGSTQTMALLPGSPAIAAGSSALVAGQTTDQRGVARTLKGTVDIGAFESRGFTLTDLPGTGAQATSINTAFAPLGVSVTSSYAEPVQGGTVNFTATEASDGATAFLGSSTATIGASGVATVSAAANAIAGSYTATAAASGAAATTFSLTNQPATPVISWANPADIVYGTALSSTQLDATANVPGTLSYTPAIGTILGAGNNQTLSVTFIPNDTNDYTSATATVQINVAQATPVITWSNPANITYGTPLSATQLDAAASAPATVGTAASLPGTFVYTPAAGTILSAGNNQTLTVTFTPNDATDYTSATATAQINVAQATPVITWSNPADITYGTALSAAQLDATANVPGTFTYTPAIGTILGAGNNQALSVSFTPNDATDYTSATATAQINVAQATPVITWSNPADITYGTALSAAQLDATANVPGTFTYTPAAGTVLGPGNNQTLFVTFTPSDATDYATASATTNISVTWNGTVYVNSAWAGDALDAPVAWSDNSTHYIGYDAFATIQAGVNAAPAGCVVNIAAGTYTEQVAIPDSLTLAGAGAAVTTLQSPGAANSGAEILITGAGTVAMSGVGIAGSNNLIGIDERGGTLSAQSISVSGFSTGLLVESGGNAEVTGSSVTGNTTGIAVVSASAATVTGCAVTGDTSGIVVGSGASDASTVTASNDSLAADGVGVNNLETGGSLSAVFDWWGATTGPASSGNPGGTGSAAIGNVNFSPWLGDANTANPDYLVFEIGTGNQYVASPNASNTSLGVSLGGSVLGTIPGGDTLGFTGSGGSVTINGESGSASSDTFAITDTSVQFAAADGLKSSTINFIGAGFVRDVDAAGSVNTFNIEGAGVNGPSGSLVGDSGTNLFVFSSTGELLGNIQGAGSSTLSYAAYSSGVSVNLQTGTATGVVAPGTVSGITAIIGSNFNDTLNAGNVPGVMLTGGLGTNTLSGTGAGDSVAEAISSSYTLTNAQLTGTGANFTDNLSGITVASLIANGASATFNVSGWTGTGSLATSSATATVTASKAANFALTNTALSSSDGMSLAISNVSVADLTVTATSGNPVYVANASAFTGTTNLLATGTVAAVLLGSSGAGSTLGTTSSGDSILIGGSGSSTLSDTGSGYNILISGGGVDSVTGSGNDILIGGTTNYDADTPANIAALDAILAEWGSSDTYALKTAKILTGVGPGSIDALNISEVTPDSVASTLSDGSASTQNNWFVVGGLDKVTKKSNEAATVLQVGGSQGSALLVGRNTTLEGNWIGGYGSQGYNVIGSAVNYPSYATVSVSGQANYTWSASTTDPRGLENPSGQGRIAACWYSSTGFSIKVNFTDGQTHELALYAVDWDNKGRTEEIQITSAATGAVLDTEMISSFTTGAYLQWALSGSVVIEATNLSSSNAVVSGLFFDPVPTPSDVLSVSGLPSTETAGSTETFTVSAITPSGQIDPNYTGTISFASSDLQAVLPASYTYMPADAGVHTFSVTFKTAGAQSISAKDTVKPSITGTESNITVVAAGASSLLLTGMPASATVGTAFTFAVTAYDPYGNVATGYAGTVAFTSSDTQAMLPASYTFNSSDAGTHQFSATLNTAGTQSITATDAVTATITGSVNLTVNPASSVSAVLLKRDTTTQGNWIGVYGSQGYNVIGSAVSYPGYAKVSVSGQTNYTWAATTTDPRGLENPNGQGRIAACWYSSTGFSITMNFTDGQIHNLALYFVDWDNRARKEQIQITSDATGAVLDTETISSFSGGVYLQWAISGSVVIKVTNLSGPNAVISGVFFN